MAGVQQRPNAFFRITPADAANARTFAVRRGEVQTRLDAGFHSTSDMAAVITALHRDTHTIAEFCEFIDSGRSISDRLDEAGIPAYEVGHISPCELKAPTYLVSPDTDKILKRHDLLTGRVGGLGAVAEYESDMPASFSDNVLRIRPKEQNKARSAFVAEYLNSSIGNTQLLRGSRGSLQKVITQRSLGSIVVPSLGELETEITSTMSAARAKCRVMLDEADVLLAGIDAFVLSALEINPTPPQANVFTTSYAAIKGSRFDPDFHSLRFRTIRNALDSGLHPAKSIGELCEYIRTGFAAGRQDQAFDYETGVPHIRPLNLDVLGQVSLDGTKFVPKTSVSNDKWCVRGEVLFNNTNSTGLVGKSAVFDLKQPCACSNHITRLKPYDGVEPEFLASMLNALRQLGYLGLLSTNFNNQAGVNVATLSHVRIPVPPLEEQGRIVGEILERRNKARRMRSEAEVILRDAKQRFETQLLGGVENC